MDIQAHKRTLGIVHIIYGSMIAVIFLFIGAIITTFAPFLAEAIIEEEGREAAVILELAAGIIKVVIIFCMQGFSSWFKVDENVGKVSSLERERTPVNERT